MGIVDTSLPQDTVSALKELAKSKREQCGFILSDGSIIKIENVAESDSDFEMENTAMLDILRRYWQDLHGVYHTHPSGRIEPTEQDAAYAPPYLQ